MREASFVVPMDVPRGPRDKHIFKSYLRSMLSQCGTFGKNGASVGLGFVWETHTALSEAGLNTLSRRVQRALKASGLVDPLADTYFLTQRVRYIREGEPNAIFTLKEGE